MAVLAASSVATAKTVRGTNGADVLYGTPRADLIYGYGGQDFLYGGKGNDRLDGGPGQDHIKGGPGDDVILGGGGEPVTETTPHGSHEYIRGGEGDDVMVIRSAGTIVWAGPGNDRLDLRDGQNRCRIRTGSGLIPARRLDPPHCVDLANTGPGDNFVRADDGNFDGIDCFGRRDRVLIDQYDYVNENCDIVRRVKR